MSNNTLPIEILVAEDADTDAFFVEQAFGQASLANNVHWVKDGNQVIDFLKKTGPFEGKPRPHLIILDLAMPDKDGYEVLAEIKGDETLRDIPVVVMSASMKTEDIKRAYALHANAYMPKTNGFEDMLEFARAMEHFWFLKARLPQDF